jgi:hypothetical protein
MLKNKIRERNIDLEKKKKPSKNNTIDDAIFKKI